MNIKQYKLVSTAAILAGLALAGQVNAAPMQAKSRLNLTQAQEQQIAQAVNSLNDNGTAPADVQATVGAKLPDNVRLRPLPASVTDQMPKLKRYDYVKLQNEVVIVNPRSKRVMDVITQ